MKPQKNQNQKQNIMENERIPKALLRLGLPTMIGMLVSALYSVVDTYFVSGLGTSQVGAISIVFPIIQLVIGLAMMFGTGAASYISRLLGEKDFQQANRVASTAIVSSLVVSMVAVIVSLCFLDAILETLGATETILPYARAYAAIYIAGCIFTIFNVTMNNIITAEGATRFTMCSMLIGGLVNVVLDPVFIYPLGFGIEGAAIATVLSQVATTSFYLWYVTHKKGSLHFSLRYFTFDGTIFAQILKIGGATLIYQMLTGVALALTNTAASRYGDSVVAGMGVVMRILTLGTYVVFGYMKGFQPLAGYTYGASHYGRLEESIKVSLIGTTVFCISVSLVFEILPRQILALFGSNDATMLQIGTLALRANGITFVFFGFEMVFMALFQALGRGKLGGLLSISRQGLFFIPSLLILSSFFGLTGIIYAQPVADLLTVVLTAIFAFRFRKNLKELNENQKSMEA